MPTTSKDYKAADDAREAFLTAVRDLRLLAAKADQDLTALERPLRDAIIAQIDPKADATAEKGVASTELAKLEALIAAWPARRDAVDEAVTFAAMLLPTFAEDLPTAPEPAPNPDPEAP